MGVTTFKDANGKIYAKGMPAISKVLTIFGLLFILFGVIALLSGDTIQGFIVATLGNIIIFVSRRYQNSVQQRKANAALAVSKTKQEPTKDANWMTKDLEN